MRSGNKYILSACVSCFVLFGAAILIVIILLIGMTFYSLEYIATSFSLCRNASRVLSELAETKSPSNVVMERCRLPETC